MKSQIVKKATIAKATNTTVGLPQMRAAIKAAKREKIPAAIKKLLRKGFIFISSTADTCHDRNRE